MTPALLCKLDEFGVIVSVSDYFLAVTRHTREGVVNGRFAEVMNAESALRFERDILPGILKGDGTTSSDVRLVRADGTDMDCLLQHSIDRTNESELIIHVALVDISPQKRFQEELRLQAITDPLTGLHNRAFLVDAIERRLSKTDPGTFTMCLLDLDDFKEVNDTMGHDTGDALLVAVSKRLRNNLRAHDLLARLGGDEFAIILDRHEGNETIERLNRSFTEPVSVSGRLIHVHASIGVANFPKDGQSLGALLAASDIAMYEAKRRGKSSFHIYNEELAERARLKSTVEDTIREGLDHGWFQLVYQDIVRLSDRRPVGCEALLRLRHPETGNLRPDLFIPIAEQSSLILDIGEWVIQRAIADLARIRLQPGFENHYFSINVSSKQMDWSLIDSVRNAIEHHGVPAEAVCLEVTETAIVEDHLKSAEILSAIQDLGCSVALDDFGTGYSSLTHLHALPFDIIKIDRSFIVSAMENEEIDEFSRSIAVIAGLAKMSQKLSTRLIAEGIETEAQGILMHDMGIDMAQGYLFGKPRPLVEYANSRVEMFDHQPG
jgi:diguanylate cyclase (GGDEF)-like protein